MSPVVLIGLDSDGLRVVGLYESAEAAQRAVNSGHLPEANYSVMTPALNSCVQRRAVAPATIFKFE